MRDGVDTETGFGALNVLVLLLFTPKICAKIHLNLLLQLGVSCLVIPYLSGMSPRENLVYEHW